VDSRCHRCVSTQCLQVFNHEVAHLLEDGRVRAIGVSNFMVEHLQTLRRHTTVTPAVNQIEVHPFFTQPKVRQLNDGLGILTQAWSPIGGITSYGDSETTTFEAETIRKSVV